MEGPDGKFYGVFLAIRPNVNDRTVTGRETFLLPVDWSGKWPVFENGLIPIEPILKLPQGVRNLTGKNGFIPQGNFGYKDNLTADTLDYRWFGLRIPIDSVARTTKRGLQFMPNEFNITHDRPLSGAWTRQIHTDFSFSAEMAYLPRNEKDLAGIACIQSSKCNYVFGVTCKGKEYWLVLQRNAKGNGNIVASHPLEYNARINLKVSAHNDEYQFSYSLDGGKLTLISGNHSLVTYCQPMLPEALLEICSDCILLQTITPFQNKHYTNSIEKLIFKRYIMKIKNVLFTIIAGSCLFSCQLQSGNRGINYYVDAQMVAM